MSPVAGAVPKFNVVLKRSIADISETEWDYLGNSLGLFWTHRFFRAVEQSHIENSRHYYVLVYSANTLVASAVLTEFVVSLDLFMPRPAQQACAAIRRLWPDFMKIQVLFCGSPVSIGKHTLAFAQDVNSDEIILRVVSAMEKIAWRRGIRYLCLKEFAESDLTICRSLKSRRFFQANSIPRVLLPIKWSNYDAYISDMRHGYRRQLLSSLKTLGLPMTETISGDFQTAGARASIHSGAQDLSEVMHKLYMQVLNHTDIKLEILNLRFFEMLFEFLKDDIKLLIIEDRSAPLAAAVLSIYQKRLTFLFAGIDYSRRDQHASYLNLLNLIVKYAIEQRCKIIDLGQTSYWVKQRLGGQAESMYFYLRAESKLAHGILVILKSLLFPKTHLPNPRVFRSPAG